jgi:hypothetical protein
MMRGIRLRWIGCLLLAALAPALEVRELAFAAAGVTRCALFPGTRPLLGVQFGQARAQEFTGVFEALHRALASGRGPRSAVVLLGHGTGASIAGEAISTHLRRHRTFYETFGGARPAAPVECLVIASCSRGSAVQMSEMRDGLGYYPVWRIATADRTVATAATVLAAFQAVVERPEDPPFRAVFRLGKGLDAPASLAEASRDGERGELRIFTVTVADGQLVSRER